MREILFKAKRIDNGEWVEGYFTKGKFYYDEREMAVILPIDLCFYPNCEITEWFEVEESTICQYTGLTDKNGNKIWENDIVNDSGDEEICKCIWDSNNCEYVLNNKFAQYGLGYCVGEELEVIGNIFDNEELLGGAE